MRAFQLSQLKANNTPEITSAYKNSFFHLDHAKAARPPAKATYVTLSTEIASILGIMNSLESLFQPQGNFLGNYGVTFRVNMAIIREIIEMIGLSELA